MKSIKQRFSLRTLGMLLCAYIWVWIGVGNFLDVPRGRDGVIYLYLPSHVRAFAWIGMGLLALCTAWSRRRSVVGLIGLVIPPLAVVASYGYAWALALIPLGSEGYDKGYYSAALYLGMLGLVVMTALCPSAPARRVKK